MSKMLTFLKALLTSSIVWFSLGTMLLIGVTFEPIIGAGASFVAALVASVLVYGNLCLLWPRQRKKLRNAFDTLRNNPKQDTIWKPIPKADSHLKALITSPIFWGSFGINWLVRTTFVPVIGESAAFALGLVAMMLILANLCLLWPRQRRKYRISAEKLVVVTKKMRFRKRHRRSILSNNLQ